MTLVDPHRSGRASLFADDLRSSGDHVAVVAADRTVTYTELDDAVEAVTSRLGSSRRLVLIEAANDLGALTAYLGALRGGHPALLAPAGNRDAVRSLAAAYDPDVVVAADDGWALHERRATSAHDLHPDLALLLSTSGSTGSPKLVRLSRANLQANAEAIVEYLGITTEDRAVTTMPMQYCYGLSVVNSHLEAGATLVLNDLSVVDRCFWDRFRRTGATSFAGVPHTFDLLDRAGFEALSLPTLRQVTQAGGRMHPDTVRRYAELGARDGWDLFVMYGQTEATARMAYLPPALASTHPHAIGVPVPGGALSVEAPDEEGVGELVYRGANVMMGYAEVASDLSRGQTVDALRTGDLGRRTADGLYEVVGRRSRFVKPYGLRIDLDRTERLLADHGLTAACTGDDDLLAVAVEGDHAAAAGQLVASHVGLPRSRVCVLGYPDGQLPRLANGKPDHAELRRRAAEGGRRQPSASEPAASGAVGTDVAAAVRSTFAEVLGTDAAEEDSFVSLGGDSLSYVEMSIRLEAMLGALPRDWHRRPIGELVTRPAPARHMARIDTSVALRALAIVLIVGSHAGLWAVTGGAHTLLAIAGFNLARFEPRPAGLLASVARIAVPSMCWIGLVAAVSDEWRWPNALLLNGWLGASDDPWGYWYIEVLVQVVVPVAALLAVPAVRRWHRRAPFGVALAAVAAGLVVRFDLLVDVDTTWTMSRPHEVFWIFAVGWAAAHARTPAQRLLVTGLTMAAVPGFFGAAPQEVIVVLGIALVTWVPVVPVPRPAGRLVGWVAGASLYTYLTHYQVYPPVSRLHGPGVAVVVSLLVGMAVWSVARRAVPAGEHALRRAALRVGRRSPAGATA